LRLQQRHWIQKVGYLETDELISEHGTHKAYTPDRQNQKYRQQKFDYPCFDHDVEVLTADSDEAANDGADDNHEGGNDKGNINEWKWRAFNELKEGDCVASPIIPVALDVYLLLHPSLITHLLSPTIYMISLSLVCCCCCAYQTLQKMNK
jgi:hypothetical protein